MAEGKFNENTRVQVPAALHLVRLGYTYLAGIKDDDFNADTNILTKIFLRSIKRINPDLSDADAMVVLSDVIRILGNDDLGREFYEKLSSVSGIKLIDFDNPDNNEWHVKTGRPEITSVRISLASSMDFLLHSSKSRNRIILRASWRRKIVLKPG